MFKSDILFNGYYGQLNTGDDAFVEVASWASKKIMNKDRIRFLAKQHQLPETLSKIRGFPLTVPKSYSFQQKILIENADSFISAGGSTFHGKIEPGSPKFLALKKKKKNRKAFNLGAIGVSLGPFKSSEAERSVVNYLHHLDFLALRDRRSFEYAKSLDLSYDPVDAFDLAALLPDIYKSKISEIHRTNGKKVIGISLCNYERYTGGDEKNEKRRNRNLEKLIRELDKTTDISFNFFVINGHPSKGDELITKQTIQNLKLKNSYEIIPYSSVTESVWLKVAKCDFMLSTRLHGAIFACFANVPFMLTEYHVKCSDFLQDIGYYENYRLYDAEMDPKEHSEIIRQILDNPQNYKFPENIQAMIEKAYLNFTKIKF